MKKLMPVFIAVLAVAAVGAWYWLVYRQPAVMPAAAPAGAPAPAIANPVPTAGGALPALDQSDASLTGALADLMGAGAVSQYLLTDNLVRRIVVTVDNLPRPKLAVEQRPVRPTAAPFLADGDDQHATVAAANAARYTAVMHVLGAVDVRQLAGVYLRYYPLFQRAYQDLGYPNGYFNDRLVKVIDDLLATPDPPEPIALVRPKVFYEFADPELESRSAGQKLLLRMGRTDRAIIKDKLRQLRTAVAALPQNPAGGG